MIVNKYANGNGGGGGTGSTITVDAALSTASTNPVENRVITTALSEYTTNEYVESRFDAAEAYTDSQVNNLEEALSAAITAATENMATQDYVDTAINEELQDYATEAYVDAAITAATQNFVTSGDVTTAITAATENLATEQYVNNAVSSASTEIYEYVDAAILTGATITVDDALSTASTNPVENRVIANKFGDYYTKSEVDNQFTTAATAIGQAIDAAVQGLASEQYVDNAVSGLASEDYVDNAVTSATEGLASEGYVDAAITAATQNLVTEEYVDNAIATAFTVDDALDTGSTNPVENKVVAKKFENYATKTQLDSGWTDSTDIVISENNSLYKATLESDFEQLGEVTFKRTNISNVFAYHYEIPQSEQVEGVTWGGLKLSGLKFSTSVYYDFEGNSDNGMITAYQDYFYYGIAQRSQSVPGYGNNSIMWGANNFMSYSCDIFLDTARNLIWCQEMELPYNKSHARYVTEDDLNDYVSKEEYVNGVTGGTDIEFASGSTVWSVYDSSIGDTNHFFNTNQPGIYMIKQQIGDGASTVSSLTGNGVLYGFMKENPEDYHVEAELDVEYSYSLYVDEYDPTMTDTIQWQGDYGLFGTYYLILNTNNQTIKLSAKPVIPHVYPSLDDFVTSGDVEDMIEDVVATAITIDSALSTGSTNPVENRVIANALGNFVQSTSVRTIVSCSQAAYDAMQSHDPNTFYIITGVNS